MIDVLIATTNFGKVKEFQFLLANKRFNLLSLKDFKTLEAPKEIGNTFEENAKIKADFYFKNFKIPVIVEDSGFCIEKLNGFPGVHSADLGENGNFANGIKKIYEMLDSKPSEASFVSVIIFKSSEKEILVKGEVRGEIAKTAKGLNGFGFDSCFIPFNENKTFGEMTLEEKSKFSHRGIAMQKLMEKL